MGLDQYAYRASAIESNENKDEQREEIAYWRKHPNLQGWMESLYREKGGEGEFNCVDVELTLEDLDNLLSTVNEDSLPETQGFFYGENSDNFYRQEDLEFIQAAKDAIDDGDKVYYTSWW